jgi:hypothetical protein
VRIRLTSGTVAGAIPAGTVFKILVEGASETNFVMLQAVDGSTFVEIDRIGFSGGANSSGFIEVMALQDNPTTAAHWRVVAIEEAGGLTTGSPIWTATTNPSVLTSAIQTYQRNGRILHIDYRRYYTNAGSGVTRVDVPITVSDAILNRVNRAVGWDQINGIGGMRASSSAGSVPMGTTWIDIDSKRIIVTRADASAVNWISLQFVLHLDGVPFS